MTSDESDPPDESADGEQSRGQPRDPETGRFLAKDERPEAGTDPSESATSEDDSTADSPAAAEASAQSRARPRTTTTAAAPPRTVFVPNPSGYPRPSALYLPALPWLRLPSRPPTHRTVRLTQ
ncbi:hypothetical protein NDI56_18120 [Haloarcula sp. S1CR25-12]|uniref:Uncharacterized protein n=1 Tax=Haloarcula saliterrae TaxID=2950534 RepID=A0ABU2FHZ5_9EURY|nr:hypothetical protein [Haloarcula sp. S1CR25-12]MDS0261320.1 hypothetical protein [Haloarcula sp. S1CR25-12]